MEKFYTTKDIAKMLGYSSPRTFLFAAKKANKERQDILINQVWNARIPAKVGRNILWFKSAVDNILKESK